MKCGDKVEVKAVGEAIYIGDNLLQIRTDDNRIFTFGVKPDGDDYVTLKVLSRNWKPGDIVCRAVDGLKYIYHGNDSWVTMGTANAPIAYSTRLIESWIEAGHMLTD